MLRLMLRLLQIIKKIRLLNNTGFNIMFFYANSLINPPPYTIPLPLTGERDVSFWRYGVRCFISLFLYEGEQCGDDGFLVHKNISCLE